MLFKSGVNAGPDIESNLRLLGEHKLHHPIISVQTRHNCLYFVYLSFLTTVLFHSPVIDSN